MEFVKKMSFISCRFVVPGAFFFLSHWNDCKEKVAPCIFSLGSWFFFFSFFFFFAVFIFPPASKGSLSSTHLFLEAINCNKGRQLMLF